MSQSESLKAAGCALKQGQHPPPTTTKLPMLVNYFTTTNATSSSLISSQIKGQPINSLLNQQCNQTTVDQSTSSNNNSENRPPRAKLLDRSTLIDILIKNVKRNCLLSCLLGATLVASIANTLLLSFLIKWIQASDRGLMSGKITWDEHSDTTLFQLLARQIPDKSILLNSIESYGDKPMHWSFYPLKTTQQQKNKLPHYYSNHKKHAHQIFLSNKMSENRRHKQQLPVGTAKGDYEPQLNYLAAVDVKNNLSNPLIESEGSKHFISNNNLAHALEIGANSLVMTLLNDAQQHQTNKPAPLVGTSDDTTATGTMLKKLSISPIKDAGIGQRLLEFNARLLSISLPLEKKINLNPSTSHTLIVDEEVVSSSIIGSLERNLDIQTRNSSIICSSDELMKLVSKSGTVRITSSGDFNLVAPVLVLNPSSQLYFRDGIQYFDSVPSSSPPLPHYNNIKQRKRRAKTNDSQNNWSKNSIRAYNLVSINEFLMAST